MQHIIELIKVIQHAVFFEQAKGFDSFHLVCAFISFQAKYLEIRCITNRIILYHAIPPINIQEAPAARFLLPFAIIRITNGRYNAIP